MKRILIANRGEIACRIARTCRSMGIETVAVYSEADRDALHVSQCDTSVGIGPAKASDSYLNYERILDAAKTSGADAVHPGYGFLAENARFAERVRRDGMVWIGPAPEHIELMGDKASARAAAAKAGVPILLGSSRLENVAAVEASAAPVGFPLLIKAVAGGGGIGMQRVDRAEDLGQMATRAMGLAERAFGSREVYLEKFIPVARHVEVQILGDGKGHAIHLFDRDCSVQRRFQKVIEEATAPLISGRTRAAMGEAAVHLAAQIGYAGLGTVEYVYDVASDKFYFLEMNTRIQVEHPVTEMVTREDLVRRQLLVASGASNAVPAQREITHTGHSIEARIYAEWPEKNFIPSPGVIERLELHADIDPFVRIDTGYRAGDRVSVFYDPLVAKVIAWDEDRSRCIARLRGHLAKVEVGGIRTNVQFLVSLLGHSDFAAANLHTGFVDAYRGSLIPVASSNRVAN